MSDRKGNPLRSGDRVRHQLHPNRAWALGTINDDGLICSDYNGSLHEVWRDCTERVS